MILNRQTLIYVKSEKVALYPSPHLYPSPYLHPNKDTLVIGRRNGRYASGISSGTLQLNELLMDEFSFGQCNSNKFSCKVFDVPPDIKNAKIVVTQIIDDVEIPIFTGYIDSAKFDKHKYYRDIVAYDALYYFADMNIAKWWNDFWKERETSTLKQLREGLFDFIELEYDTSPVFNDDFIVEKTIETDSMKFRDMLHYICELSLVNVNIDREGIVRFISLNPNNKQVKDVTTNYKNTNSNFENYETAKITRVQVFNEDNELIAMSGASNDNVFSISDNIFTYGKSKEELQTLADNMLNDLKDITYRPAIVNTNISDLSIQLGDLIDTPEGITYVMENNLSGVQLSAQEMISEGDEYLDEAQDYNSDFQKMKDKTNQILQTMETDYIKTTQIDAIKADIEEAVIEYADIHYLTTDFANIAQADIDVASIGQLFANVGLITDATIKDGHITGYLDAVKVNADVIDAGTLSVDRLIIKGSDKSIMYKLNEGSVVSEQVTQEQLENLLHGEHIIANTITATQIAAGTITASEIASTTITADKMNVDKLSSIKADLGTITAGVLQSKGYVEGSTGMKLNLNTATWDSKYFKIDSEGKITSTGGTIGGWSISGNTLAAGVTTDTTRIVVTLRPTQTQQQSILDANFILDDGQNPTRQCVTQIKSTEIFYNHLIYYSSGAVDRTTLTLNDHGLDCNKCRLTGYFEGTFSGTIITESSKRYKDNIQGITQERIDKILKLNVVTYDYKKGTVSNNQYDRVGVIAEDTVDIIPESIYYKDNQIDSVDYTSYIPYLIALCQRQEKEIKELKKLL